MIELVSYQPDAAGNCANASVTPAYVNGDALAGNRDLVAGDVIELIGVPAALRGHARHLIEH